MTARDEAVRLAEVMRELSGKSWLRCGTDELRQTADMLELLSRPAEGVVVPRTKKECLDAVVKELNLDITDPFTRVLAAAFALQDAYEENRAALMRCQQLIHDAAAPAQPSAGPHEPPMVYDPKQGKIVKPGQPSWVEEELKDGDRICEAAGVQRTEGGRLQVAKIINALRAQPSEDRRDAERIDKLMHSVSHAITLMEVEGNTAKSLSYLREALAMHEAAIDAARRSDSRRTSGG